MKEDDLRKQIEDIQNVVKELMIRVRELINTLEEPDKYKYTVQIEGSFDGEKWFEVDRAERFPYY